jgi:hypothetical protein
MLAGKFHHRGGDVGGGGPSIEDERHSVADLPIHFFG